MEAQHPPPPNVSRGHQTVIIVVVFTSMSFITVFLRCITRFGILKAHGPDDILILVAMLSAIATTICQCLQVRYGSGKHVDYVTEFETVMSLKYLFFSILSYNTGLATTKFAILILYRRIFVNRSMRIASLIVMVLVGIYFASTIISGIFMCVPVHAFWEIKLQPTARCVNEFALFYANAGLNIVSDFALLILPIPFVLKLQVSKRRKITLIMVLSLGFLTCLVSILRLHSLYIFHQSPDPTWEQPAAAYWSGMELNMGIICACLPTLRPLFGKFAPRVFSSKASMPSGYNEPSDKNRYARAQPVASHDSFTMLHLERDAGSDRNNSVEENEASLIYPKGVYFSDKWTRR
ncbi:hypothetical protein AJ80_06562 [Polytolypa hystricis UAMH7299]|uniref:Rhodopsin domain-containing protein n=1 Tax=Polytolypa hystricis (strain UAMH7299) TaxID=1447883 RepID=A0A2B7XVN6_POLH7|nr:hypothetical protein AJ80_06562 [Polytolypa hystricis UAMH7299]